MTESGQNLQEKLSKLLQRGLLVALVIFGFLSFLFGGITSLLNASQTTLSCQVAIAECSLIQSKLLGTEVDTFPLDTLAGAYLTPQGEIKLQTQPEQVFFSQVYEPTAPYGQDILNQAIVQQINEFVQNPNTDLTVRTSNRLFSYAVAGLLLLAVAVIPAFGLRAVLAQTTAPKYRFPWIMLSGVVFLTGIVIAVAIGHGLELQCENSLCQLAVTRLQGKANLTLPANQLQQAQINSRVVTGDEGETRTYYQVVLVTTQGDLSLLSNSDAVAANRMADQVNRFIANPQQEQVEIREGNWWLVASLGGVCILISGVMLIVFLR